VKDKLNKLAYRILGMKQGEELKATEAYSYSIAGFGQNLVCGLIGSSYLVYYFTNGLLINPVVVGFIMLFTRLFDAFNDPIMGSIVDRTRTRWGKCRPYLLWTPIPIAILTACIFLPLPPHVTSTAIIATAIYVLWSIIYTIVDVPYWGLATQMTANTHTRGSILTVARLFCTVGSGLISLVIPSLLGSWLGNMQDANGRIIVGYEEQAAQVLRQRFIWVAVVIAALSIVPFFLGFKNTKERFYTNDKPKSLGHNLKLLIKNKPLLIIICSGVLGAAKMMTIYSGIYFCEYALGNVNFFGMHGIGLHTVVTLSVVPGGLIATVLTPLCTRKFGKKATFIVSNLVGGVVLILVWIIGYDAPWKLIIALFGLIISGVPQGFGNIISYAMIGDTVDYLDLHYRERAEGICFAMQTFMNKVGMALGAAVSAFGLSWAKINPDDMATVTTQGLNTLWAVTVLLAGVSMVLTTIPMFFYKFTEKEQRKAIEEIEARKLREATPAETNA
jgi:sugar (glycoside-pentoside-hexuronide) transporter